ncbi:putative ABC transporter ATP-binding protein [Haemophilus influenzae]|uniref:Probable ABC transporter ATP-binding/permease protein HI_0664 n=2 Tax=Haemophilus influenzae TaxID=727 RepID=Y664_HAEIN|nr:thiol reductant ABC exporter subunit CydC [Haemophilus influenzae]Q57538.1 RecName: Full=Probable ABC transporter ATP-binding/permease protein HI_0664 [Haemophilus influenzae Rd KW20]AAC22321.1 ABC transporter, ATP-binding protein [Haemophilus influenzae Rd KW20]ARB90234.1 ABC transporter ATP-binding protein [Haemophilus influenzae]EDK11378.1 ABC transporter ATP-binding protein [Haemophilus influenzae PittII]EEW75794.1 ABC transporter, CydDC cysteine exporter (CydDC-E) family, permease/ATP-
MRKNGFVVMGHLLKLVTPLAHIMAFTITMGTLGFLAAIFIMVLGATGLVNLLNFDTHLSFSGILTALIVLAVARGALRYLEQMSGHYIAFKLLALLRDKVFSSLRRLAFVKLQDKQAGQLVSLVTNDIELLEVFYAHTIAPIMIAFFTSAILLLVFAQLSSWFVLVALAAYLTVGVILPIITTKLAREDGRRYRELVGEMNDFFLDSVRGMKEIQLFGYAKQRLDEIQQRSQKIDTAFERIKDQEAKVRVYTEVAVSVFNIIMLFTGLILFSLDKIDFAAFLIGVILLMSSYGPVIALSNLSSNLLQTLASGERVLSLLAEEPELKDVESAVDLKDVSRIDVENVNFAYGEEQILSDVSLSVKKGEILGIHGRSGSGKSTLLKLLMRFYDPKSGSIKINGETLPNINTCSLRDNMAYITQQTYIFNETIEENIRLARRDATLEEIMEAAKKASIHDFILSLPQGYQTKMTELGGNLSDGEKQRIGIARAFLHNAPIILLDEPTSNLDSLNEAMILKSLLNVKAEKLIILVSHRQSTMAICDQVIGIENGRMS